jgi:alpha-D-ribose 1-methylphosphonate 5-triphosphate diphosphatase
VQAYDGQIATSGITTVFDSLRVGTDEHETRTEFVTMTMQLAEALERAKSAGLLRVDHRTHLRCEVPTLDVLDALEAFIARYPVDLISLMDHTPGQRQFRDLDKYFIYYGGKTGKSMDEVHAVVSHRQRVGSDRAARHRPTVVEMAHKAGIALASHDDTTLEEVRESIGQRVRIAEFPTTVEAAAASREAGMATVAVPGVIHGSGESTSYRCRPTPQPLSDFSTRPPSAWAMAWCPKQTPTSFVRPSAARIQSSRPAIQPALS